MRIWRIWRTWRRVLLVLAAARFYARRPAATPDDVQLAATQWETWATGRGWDA